MKFGSCQHKLEFPFFQKGEACSEVMLALETWWNCLLWRGYPPESSSSSGKVFFFDSILSKRISNISREKRLFLGPCLFEAEFIRVLCFLIYFYWKRSLKGFTNRVHRAPRISAVGTSSVMAFLSVPNRRCRLKLAHAFEDAQWSRD